MKRKLAVMLSMVTFLMPVGVYAGENKTHNQVYTPPNDITTSVYFINDLLNNYNDCNVYNNGGNIYYDPVTQNEQRINNLQNKYPNTEFTKNDYYNTYNNYKDSNVYNDSNVTYNNSIDSNNVNSYNNGSYNNDSFNTNTNTNNETPEVTLKDNLIDGNQQVTKIDTRKLINKFNEEIDEDLNLNEKEIEFIKERLYLSDVEFDTSKYNLDMYPAAEKYSCLMDFKVFGWCDEIYNEVDATISESYAGTKACYRNYEDKKIYEYIELLKRDGFIILESEEGILMYKIFESGMADYIWLRNDGEVFTICAGVGWVQKWD